MIATAAYLFCFVLVAVNGAHLPSYVKACKARSPDFGKCAVANGKAAIPSLINGEKSLGIPSFNPLHIPYVEFSSGDLKLNGTDVHIYGLSKFDLTEVSVDLTKNTMIFKGLLPEVSLEADYSIGGKIVSLPLEGHGKTKLVAHDAGIRYSFDFGVNEKGGVKFIQLLKDDFEITPKKLSIQFDNLFNGDKLLGDNTNKFLNENWPEVLKEFKPALNEIFSSVMGGILGPITNTVPLTEIFPDY